MISLRRTARGRWLGWFLLGFAVALWLQWTQALTFGGDWSGLIATSQDSPMREAIERELGSVALASPEGHDGQASFLIAVDPFNERNFGELFDHAAYRYRRILYPLLAGGFGFFSGNAILIGLVIVAAVGFGAAVASTATLARSERLPIWVVLGTIANPGLWLSLRLLTSDALAYGMAVSGLLLWLKGRESWGLLFLALAILAKDQYLLVAMSLAGWVWTAENRRRSAVVVVAATTLPLLVWIGWLSITMGDGAAVRGNLRWLGIVDAIPRWRFTPVSDQVLIWLTVASTIIVVVAAVRCTSLFRWLAAPWLALTLISSDWVWNIGNNAARVFAPLWLLAFAAIGALATKLRTRAGS